MKTLLNLDNFLEIKGIVINLKNVSTIKYLQNRIIFNMNYTIEKNGNVIPDYVYIDNYVFEDCTKIANNKYFEENFITIDEEISLNKNAISSFKYEENNKRYVINLTNAHTYNIRKGNKTEKRVMSEFVYKNED